MEEGGVRKMTMRQGYYVGRRGSRGVKSCGSFMVDGDVLDSLKMIAIVDGKTTSEIVEELILKYVIEERHRKLYGYGET